MERYCDDKIVLAYWKTTYRLVDQGIDVFIAEKNDDFIDFVRECNFSSWAIITAWNPKSEHLSKEKNRALNLKLQTELNDSGFVLEAVLGIPDSKSNWIAEESFFIGNISMEDACGFGKKYRQNAIVFGISSCLPSLIWL